MHVSTSWIFQENAEKQQSKNDFPHGNFSLLQQLNNYFYSFFPT